MSGWKSPSFSMLEQTVRYSVQIFSFLQPPEVGAAKTILLAGVGGSADSITIETSIGFVRDDGQMVTVRGTFGVFTRGESADLSILGRDVINNFSVIYDYPRQIVALLTPPHSYEIKRP